MEKYTPAENRTRVCLAHLAETEFRPVTIPLRYRRHGPSIDRKLYLSQISLEKYKPRQYETQINKGNKSQYIQACLFNYATILPITFKLTQAHTLKQYQT